MPWDERYEAVIGLEIHAQLLTETKAFCGCSTKFGDSPNANVCPVCLGLPGVLPVPNRTMVEFAIRMGLATDCTIAPRSLFARKNYFYPDLPKGYQISQYEEPICTGGAITIRLPNGAQKRIGITRIHMEEDAGKSIHDRGNDTLVDLNRCGVPLIEIVSEPDMRSPREAYLFMTAIRQRVTYLGICDGNLEEGSLRCDANVSVRRVGDTAFGTKTEVKNLNSFRFVEKALEYEVNRQIGLLESGRRVVQETLLWDADREVCVPMRSKEEAHDYRYFPDPDLAPVLVDADWIARVKSELPEMPERRRDRYVRDFQLPEYDAEVLTTERPVAEYFDAVVGAMKSRTTETRKLASNWVMGDVLRVANEQHVTVSDIPVAPERLAAMIDLVIDGTISGKIAKEVFDIMMTDPDAPASIVRKRGLVQVSDTSAIEQVIDAILRSHAPQVEQYRAGKQQVFGFFVGETMKAMKGKANPAVVNEILRRKLAS